MLTLKIDNDGNKYTHCNICKKNCHNPCDCNFQTFDYCSIYTFFKKKCKICGCNKSDHQQDQYYYGYETIIINKDNIFL